MVAMKKVTVGDAISGEIYKGVALMDEDPSSTGIMVDAGNKKYFFDVEDLGSTVIDLEE